MFASALSDCAHATSRIYLVYHMTIKSVGCERDREKKIDRKIGIGMDISAGNFLENIIINLYVIPQILICRSH